MIWEDTIETALQELLFSSTNMTTVRRGMQDENLQLNLPALVVWVEGVEFIPARHPLYKARIIIEYKSIPEENAVSGIQGVENIMQQVDVALMSQPSAGLLAQIPTGGALYINWEGVRRTQQEIHTDRRVNVREIEVWLDPRGLAPLTI
jgi:hypothetical protein